MFLSKRKKNFVFVAATAFAISAQALAAGDSVLGDEPNISPSAEPNYGTTAPQPGRYSYGDPGFKSWSLRAQAFANFQSYTLSANSGFQTALPSVRGTFFGGEVRYRPAQASLFQYIGRMRTGRTEFKSVPGVSPSTVNMDTDYYTMLFGLYPFSSPTNHNWDNFGFLIGYNFIERDATATSPNQVVTGSISHGMVFGLIYKTDLSSEFVLESEFSVVLPNYYREKAATTGNYVTGQVISFSVTAGYHLSRVVTLATGIDLKSERTSFTGTGQRGSTDGTTSVFSFGIPVEFRLSF